MKDGMSAFDIKFAVAELQGLIGNRIGKIYQITGDIFIIKVGKLNLAVQAGKWLFLMAQDIEKPRALKPFAGLLRKHLTNGRLIAVTQPGLERVVELHIQRQAAYRLVVELFGVGNIILVEGTTIARPLFSRDWAHRSLRPGKPYKYPPRNVNPLELSLDELKRILHASPRELVSALAVELNLGGLYAEELCKLAGIDKGINAAELDAEAIAVLFEALNTLADKPCAPVIIRKDDVLVDVVPIALMSYATGTQPEKFVTFNLALERYFFALQSSDTSEVPDGSYAAKLARYERRRSQQRASIERLKQERGLNKRIGDMIYEHYSAVEHALSARDDALVIDDVTIRLDSRKSIVENASAYYERAKKAKAKIEGALRALATTDVEIEALRKKTGKEPVEQLLKPRKTVKREWFEHYKWFISSDGSLVLAGRDARTNERLVKRHMTDADRFAHADLHGAPSIVIKGPDITQSTLREACEFALLHSKAWPSGVATGDAYWVLPDQVSKLAQAGEFVPRGAFVIRGMRNYYRHLELVAAIGEVNFKDASKLMCGPVSALSAKAQRYVVFGPGSMRKTAFAKELSGAFDATIDEVMALLPPGDVSIVKRVGVGNDN